MTWKNALPSADQDVNMFYIHDFFQSMYDRQEVWYNRFVLQEPTPWTDNKIFQEYKFTNVYRELDRNSQWEIENITKAKISFINKVWKISVFRFIINYEFFDHIGGIPDFEDFDNEVFYKQICDYRATGKNPFTTAYLVNSANCPGITRDECYGRVVLPALHENIEDVYGDMSVYGGDPIKFIKRITKLPSIGMFVAHEMYISLCYIAKYTDDTTFPFTENDWTNVGPGASSGIRILLPNLKGYKQQWEGIHMIQRLAAPYLEEHFPDFKFIYYNKKSKEYGISKKSTITLHQIEMWLCEYQKYFKMKLKMGKQRTKFKANSKDLQY